MKKMFKAMLARAEQEAPSSPAHTNWRLDAEDESVRNQRSTNFT